MSKWVLKSVKALCLVFVISSFVGCGAAGGELSQGEPLQDALARFNMAIQSGDEATALELISESERELLTQDGFTFAEKYRKGAQRLRLSTLMNNKDLALDSDDKIVGLMKVLEEANTKGRRAKFVKRAGSSLNQEDKNETELTPVTSIETAEPYEAPAEASEPLETAEPNVDVSPEESTEPTEVQGIPEEPEEPEEAEAPEVSETQEEPMADEDGFVEF